MSYLLPFEFELKSTVSTETIKEKLFQHIQPKEHFAIQSNIKNYNALRLTEDSFELTRRRSRFARRSFPSTFNGQIIEDDEGVFINFVVVVTKLELAWFAIIPLFPLVFVIFGNDFLTAFLMWLVFIVMMTILCAVVFSLNYFMEKDWVLRSIKDVLAD